MDNRKTENLETVTRRRLLQVVGAGSAGLALGVRPGMAGEDGPPAKPAGQGLRTRLTESFGLRHAFVGAGMEICALPPTGAPIGSTVLFPGTSFETPGVPMPTFSALPPTPDTTGDFDAMGMPAGESVQQIREIKPAAEIVADLMGEARAIIDRRLAAISA